MINLLVATAAALFSGLGVGSAGILVIYLTLVVGAEQVYAQGVNLLFFLFSSGAAMLVHLTKRKIYGRFVSILVTSGLLGAVVGSFLSGWLNAITVRKLFGIMLIVSGIITLSPKRHKQNLPKAL